MSNLTQEIEETLSGEPTEEELSALLERLEEGIEAAREGEDDADLDALVPLRGQLKREIVRARVREGGPRAESLVEEVGPALERMEAAVEESTEARSELEELLSELREARKAATGELVQLRQNRHPFRSLRGEVEALDDAEVPGLDAELRERVQDVLQPEA